MSARTCVAGPAPRPTFRQVLVGLFVVWQLFFLTVGNLLELVPHRPAEHEELTDHPEMLDRSSRDLLGWLAVPTDLWAEATGQYQLWRLFAPHIPPQAAFPAVELRWDENAPGTAAPASVPAPVQLLSHLEPADPASYFRWPGSRDRQFHYEVRLSLLYSFYEAPHTAAEAGEWQQLLRGRVARQWRSLRAYLRWRLRTFQEERPDVPAPRQAVLSMRLYCTPPAGQRLPEAPLEVPLARWWPHEDGAADRLPVEVYDPFAGRFERLPRADGAGHE
jgi:hypothetical protein